MSKSKKVLKKNQSTVVIVLEKVDEKILSQAIVKAYMDIEQKKKDEKLALESQFQSEWYDILRQKEYPENEKWYLKKVHKMRNECVLFWKILFFKRQDVRDMRATFCLMSLAVSGIFTICQLILFGCLIALLIMSSRGKIDWSAGIVMIFMSWVLMRVFRIAKFEMEKIKDGNLLVGIFSGSLSFVAVVIAIITLIVA